MRNESVLQKDSRQLIELTRTSFVMERAAMWPVMLQRQNACANAIHSNLEAVSNLTMLTVQTNCLRNDHCQ